MRHRRILRAFRHLCPDYYATHAAAVRDPDGLWAHFEAVCQAQSEMPDPYGSVTHYAYGSAFQVVLDRGTAKSAFQLHATCSRLHVLTDM